MLKMATFMSDNCIVRGLWIRLKVFGIKPIFFNSLFRSGWITNWTFSLVFTNFHLTLTEKPFKGRREIVYFRYYIFWFQLSYDVTNKVHRESFRSRKVHFNLCHLRPLSIYKRSTFFNFQKVFFFFSKTQETDDSDQESGTNQKPD